jgi:ATP adenylyltransferase
MIMKNCKFCDVTEEVKYETASAFAILDKYPATKYHTLIIPKRHVESYFELTDLEHMDCINLINTVKVLLCKLDDTITGFNVGSNIGRDAGQTIFHCHIHLIPRRKNDTEYPRGGIRRAIARKGDWKSLA